MAISDFLFPQGNFLDIRSNAPTQADYNIRATEDLVRNNPFRALGEIYAPALTAVTSIPYDTIQGIGRAVDNSNLGIGAYRGIVDDIEIPSGPSLSDIGRAIDAENPLSSALERTYGATLPLAERISNMFSMGQAEASDLGEIANLRSISDPKTPESVERKGPLLSNPSLMETNNPYNYAPELDVNLDPEVNMGATGTVPTLKEGILSQVDSRFPLYDDFTVAEEGDDLEDNAVTVDELGNLKKSSGIEKLLSYAPFGENSILGRVLRSLPQESPEIRSMKNFYGNRYGLTDTGQVASGIMKGYNPVSGGFLNFITGGRFGKPTSYGLADAARRRIDRIANRKAAQTDASRAKIKELQDFARADTISRARQAAPDVYASADKQGFTDSSGGFKSAGTNENFSNKTGRGRTGY